MSRFDYVKYDAKAISAQELMKRLVMELEQHIALIVPGRDAPRYKSLAITRLEETFMWIGKAIREEQLVRNGGVVELQEERKDG